MVWGMFLHFARVSLQVMAEDKHKDMHEHEHERHKRSDAKRACGMPSTNGSLPWWGLLLFVLTNSLSLVNTVQVCP